MCVMYGDTISPDSVVRKASTTSAGLQVDSGGVLLEASTGICYGINAVGAVIWQRLSEARRVDDLMSYIETLYPATNPLRIRDDVANFLRDLKQWELIEIKAPSSYDSSRAGSGS